MNMDFKNARIAIIYVYYEREGETKNQSNLSFFIKYGLDLEKSRWTNLNITTLFVIDKQTEVIIPNDDTIFILKSNITNSGFSDFEGWLNGIHFFEDKYNQPFYDSFDYLCLINASTSGPFLEENINSHWLYPFYDKMKRDDSFICSPYANRHYGYVPSQNKPILSCHFSLIKINKDVIKTLINNGVLSKKQNKEDAIVTGECRLSLMFQKVSCLYYDDLDKYLNNYDREEFHHKNNYKLKNTIFIKNIWRTGNNEYASLPVLYKFCKRFIHNKMKMTDIFNDAENMLIDYSLISNKDITSAFWNDKKEYYHKYGYAEETIIFPQNPYSSNLIFPTNIDIKTKNYAIYAHYDENNIIADYVIQGIKTLILCGYDILFYTASPQINNIDFSAFPVIINFIRNAGVGTDFTIWKKGLEKIKRENMVCDWILMLNDSILFPIHGVENCLNTIQEMRSTSDFWGHWDSNEVSWHIVSSVFEIKYQLIDDVLRLFPSDNYIKLDFWDFVCRFEIPFAQNLINMGHKYNVVVKDSELDYERPKQCSAHNPYVLSKWIRNKKSFAIKWKYAISYLNDTSISKEFNFLTRFLYYGHKGILSKGELTNQRYPRASTWNTLQSDL